MHSDLEGYILCLWIWLFLSSTEHDIANNTKEVNTSKDPQPVKTNMFLQVYLQIENFYRWKKKFVFFLKG